MVGSTRNRVARCNVAFRAIDMARRVSDRKLRLFAVACCRRASRLLFPAERAEALLEIIERYADGSASKEEVTAFLSGMLPHEVREQTDEFSVPLWWLMAAEMLQGESVTSPSWPIG